MDEDSKDMKKGTKKSDIKKPDEASSVLQEKTDRGTMVIFDPDKGLYATQFTVYIALGDKQPLAHKLADEAFTDFQKVCKDLVMKYEKPFIDEV
jgi:hypothetical protein